ncbi:MFS general substrate transporter [Durotheca rogersii]|uniref:MFS general substrate transporter n=1 Tax=Durotheca rogersii TaxID=419775 RepID=UPI00221FFCA2|nr:MFS general substrate transporter [Durotheca rogersii]KAI5863629.1 MFS general substrate transporter [Durotheca rogersii]
MSREDAGDDVVSAPATERTPLVGPDAPASPGKSGHSGPSRAPSLSRGSISASTPYSTKPAIIGLFYFIIFLVSSAGALYQIPITKIYENILCRQYYDDLRDTTPFDAGDCKNDIVQSRLAYLLAVLESLNSVISCLVAMPWGIVADRVGRKPVYISSASGIALSILMMTVLAWFSDILPARSIWFSAVAYLLGGSPVMNACIYSILTDLVPESNRSISFMRVHVTSLVGNLISPALSSAMMSSTGPWPVMLLTLVLWAVSTALVVFIPETFRRSPHVDGTESQPFTIRARARESIAQARDTLSIVRLPSISLVLAICLLSLPVIVCTFQFMVQFISKRYQIPLEQTGYVQSIYGVAHIVVVLLIVPCISNLIVRPSLPSWLRAPNENRRDLVLVRWSYAAYVAGTFILSISPSLPVFVAGLVVMSLGSGSASFIKSIAALHVDPEHRSRLFTLMSLLDVVSNVWAMPALAALFTLGMRWGGGWIGLPYLGVSLTCVAMFVLSLFVRVPEINGRDEDGPNVL